MKIDGKIIAQKILNKLLQRTKKLKRRRIIPHLVIFLIGNDPASKAYVRQKGNKAKIIGAKTTIIHFASTITEKKLLLEIEKYNSDKKTHGVIVQQPLPPHINTEKIVNSIDPKKDIDSFHPKSPFPMPLAKAVLEILKEVYFLIPGAEPRSFREWLKSKKIIVIGKGATGGKPVIKLLKELGIQPLVIDSKTEKSENITKIADIIISAVGKPNIVRPEMIKDDVVLISIGLHKKKDNKLHGDYEEEKIKNITSFYTPTPGGVGPVNVAMLLSNLLTSAEKFANIFK